RPEATAEDVRYLLAATRHAFPSLSLEPSDVLATWTGIRPLLSEEDAANPSDISREHRIEVRRDGVIVIAGGKFTTYRKMAAECLDRAATTIGLAGGTPHLRRCQTKQLPLPGSVGLTSERAFTDLERELGDAFGGDRAIGAHLATTYGIRGRNVARLAHATPGFKERIDAELPYVWAEIAHAAHSEEISTLEDVMVRRTQLFYRAFDQSLATAGHAADIIGNALGWNDRERQTQVTAYEAKIAANNAWRGHRRR
ncbi:MAG: hypothetical protein KAI47_13470, partial [Deltaproteobacteria bacterium]|nr:hypothetical protein [Deltaproteobacteria bacterium]